MSKVKYEFDLKRVAVLQTPQGLKECGDVEEYVETNGTVMVVIKFHDDVTPSVRSTLEANPTLMMITQKASPARNVILLSGGLVGV